MRSEIFNLTFITPCFCAGADQTIAELRPSAIRGQLRWWFRALGGTAEQEVAVFGGTAGENGRSSLLQVRTALIQRGTDWKPLRMSPGQPGAYIWYFASVASDKRRWWQHPPDRGNTPGTFNTRGNLPPGTKFQLLLRRIRPVTDANIGQLLELAIRSSLRFGGIGMRLSRGMGAWECAELDHSTPSIKTDVERIVQRRFAVAFGNGDFPSAQDAILDGEKWLQHDLRKQFNANRRPASPLGGIRQDPRLRQTSAVYLRPIREGGAFTMFFLEAPHDRVLCTQARKGVASPVLQGRRLSGRPPTSQSRRTQH
jgi:hypothetical protein